jgi:hypothetical protein
MLSPTSEAPLVEPPPLGVLCEPLVDPPPLSLVSWPDEAAAVAGAQNSRRRSHGERVDESKA